MNQPKLSVDEVVWAMKHPIGSAKTAAHLPAVVICNKNPNAYLVRFISYPVVESKLQERPRSQLKLFDMDLVEKYAPKSFREGLATAAAHQYQMIIDSAQELQRERQKKAQAAYDAQIRKIEANVEKDISLDSACDDTTYELSAGAHIFFWIPGQIAGRKESAMYARVLQVFHKHRYLETNIPLELDSGHILDLDTEVKMIEPVNTECMLPLRKFVLRPSAVDGCRIADVVAESVRSHIDKLRADNPEYADLIGAGLDPRKTHSSSDENNLDDPDFTSSSSKRRKPKRCTPARQSPQRSRLNRPQVSDSESSGDDPARRFRRIDRPVPKQSGSDVALKSEPERDTRIAKSRMKRKSKETPESGLGHKINKNSKSCPQSNTILKYFSKPNRSDSESKTPVEREDEQCISPQGEAPLQKVKAQKKKKNPSTSKVDADRSSHALSEEECLTETITTNAAKRSSKKNVKKRDATDLSDSDQEILDDIFSN
uniref:PWWP domain-containing protein n=1 Tax=Spongospora subterranea TaxID=70186 RepID=A0A0H5QUT1_9EUKA|eukprot:CRZ05291.1 hypothetical protein [Spongospora subterranea]